MTTTHTSKTTRAALALGAALALFAALPASTAYAANGTFFYRSAQAGDLEMNNPANGECRLLAQGGAETASNQTDTKATVYHDHGCEEVRIVLHPGQAANFTGSLPHSVQFG
ncbi:hypothetical protein [Streptomyces flavofungini]|uniref:Secreted protein n=1 Tax=Streptomyces flavofungini TaxID=68200 RepID=A0ABS0X5D2_9ACTN|nr:hypothetical protein [Streptomyces flavofungini]MBJ3808415.1 hypothetical protein [Streptomyces flavofungini]